VNLGQDILEIKLSNSIVPHQCNYTCGLKKIEIKLKKEADNYSWANLEAVAG